MKIAVIGTSNSIMSRGYVSGIRSHPAVTEVKNFSLGHSTSVVFPLVFQSLDFSSFDFCIIDFVVNEEFFEQAEDARERVRDRLNYWLSHVSASKCIPVILVMPAEARVGKVMPVHELYVQFAQDHNLPFFDGFRALERLRAFSSFDLSKYFRDPFHLIEWAAASIGFAFAEQLERLHTASVRRMYTEIIGPRYDYVRVADIPEFADSIVERKTSLISERFFHATKPGRINIHVDRSVKIVGLGVNLSQTRAALSIKSGKEQVSAFYGLDYYEEQGRKFVFVVRTVTPVQSAGWVCLEWGEANGQGPLVEMHGLALELPSAPLKSFVLELDPTSTDLAELVPENHFRHAGLVAQRLLGG